MGTPHLKPVPAPPRQPRAGEGGLSRLHPTTLQRYENGRLVFRDDAIAEESTLRLLINGQQEALLSRTPGDDLNLVAGYLFCTSRIREAGDLASVGFSYRGVARAEVGLDAPADIRRIFPSPRPVRIGAHRLFEFKAAFERRQNLYRDTGSTHAAALFTADGQLIAFGEDVGRHNAFDKAIGRALLEGTLGQAAIAMLSSRLALELAVKAATANIPVLCGFSAATSSGVRYAEENNLTLVGRLRKESFNIYANGWRILTGESDKTERAGIFPAPAP
ncbi:formate dehydrogenase accessory sulfurtransferase FdhD [Pseudodesulfovibrio sp.]|uniref:formate dehydrogenase accessory sulfurtransferase FdhD n=1 Tax=Pseudodesulfovibrio sp. TaxID=2035812 RepID=UPI002619B5F8|nr:formate dehydrogenase accessory sulfurtransferase FdhD [Pseudodesulfovibrio sp.]MDD3312209.1 formate dehydrogenase accessory sulfurtransferase FdhD [Pseudodesulfovibrio sp.]